MNGLRVLGVLAVLIGVLLASNVSLSAGMDGRGEAASFDYPSGIAIDEAGSAYVADTNNSAIRKIDRTGLVTTFAGTAAHLYWPRAVATDREGNVYVADTYNHTIRKITPSGVVTTLAGVAGQMGHADGTGAAARFAAPEGIATDQAGNIYVADTGNNLIRQITPDGVVTTLAGTHDKAGHADGKGAVATFLAPMGVCTDVAGNVYVADTHNSTIRKIGPARAVTTLAGSAGVNGHADGSGAEATFFNPKALAIDKAGNIYVADSSNDIIRKITPAGVVTTLAGKAEITCHDDGKGAAACFRFPEGIAVDRAGNVYVADAGNNTIRKLTPAGVVTTLAGKAPPPEDYE